MGLFGLGRSHPDKPRGVSLIVNQIDKRAKRRAVPKVLFVMLVASSMVAASALAVQWAQKADDSDVPIFDEVFGDDSSEDADANGDSPEENLADYDVELTISGKLTDRGEGANEDVRWALISQDFKVEKGHSATQGLLTHYDEKQGGQSMCPEYGRIFYNSMTLYLPDGKQSASQEFCHGVQHNEVHQYRVTFLSYSHGFGEYRYKGIFVDGDVDFCNWGWNKCWKYYERYYDAAFHLEKKSGGFDWF